MPELKPRLRRLFLHELAMAETRRSTPAESARRIGACLSLEGVKTAPRADPYVRIILLSAQLSQTLQREPAAWEILKRMILELPSA